MELTATAFGLEFLLWKNTIRSTPFIADTLGGIDLVSVIAGYEKKNVFS